jgi:hypothetical protein
MMCPWRHGIGEQRKPVLHPEILALQRPAAGGAVLYLFGVSLARFYIVEGCTGNTALPPAYLLDGYVVGTVAL